MNIAFFDTHQFEKNIFESINSQYGFNLSYFDVRLNEETALLAHGFKVVCSFVNDRLTNHTLSCLKRGGCELIALRSAGFNHVDLKAASTLGLKVVRVPEYSPFAVAEHAVALLLTLNRKIHRSYQRVRELNFSLDGLVGMDVHGKTVGVIGTGKIGSIFSRIMHGFGCELLFFDVNPNLNLAAELKGQYVTLEEIYRQAHIISLHVPLNSQTRYIINHQALQAMRKGVFLINTGRGALINTRDLIDQLKSGHLGGAGLDVYEEEENVFFRDHSDEILLDDTLARLLTFPNVIITSHQGFLTQEALENIARTTLTSVREFEQRLPLKYQIDPRRLE